MSALVGSAAAAPFAGVSLLDFFGDCVQRVASTSPRCACRTDASVDAEVPEVGTSTAPDPRAEAPSVWEPAAVDVPVVPVVVSDSEVALVFVAPAVPAASAELADAVSSAHAIPGVVATAIPTPSATANPPTRPMYLA